MGGGEQVVGALAVLEAEDAVAVLLPPPGGLVGLPREEGREEQLLRADSLPVLEVLRFETEALLLRTRIVADAVRQTRATRTEAVA